MIRNFRAITPLRRLHVPIQIRRSFHPPAGVINVQRVRIKRPWLRRFSAAFLAYTTAFYIWTYVISTSLGGDLDNDSKKEEGRESSGEEGEDDEDEEDSPLFIPLGFPRRIQGQHYAGSDPEWQTFRKYAINKSLMHNLKAELVSIAAEAMSENQSTFHILGDTYKVYTASMHHEFPGTAPPEYAQRGLEIRDESLTFTARKVPLEYGDRISNWLEPSPVIFSILGAGYVFLKQKFRKLQGMPAEDTSQPEKDMEGLKQPSSRVQESKEITGVHKQERGNCKTTTSLGTDITNKVNDSTQLLPAAQEQPALKRLVDFALQPDQESLVALEAFKLLMNDLRNKSKTPPKGVFLIHGLIGLRGPKGECSIYTTGQFDPKSETWVKVTTQVKSILPYSQRPLGGN